MISFGLYSAKDFSNIGREIGKSQDEVIEDLGYYIFPHQLLLYGYLIDPKWSILEVIEQSQDKPKYQKCLGTDP